MKNMRFDLRKLSIYIALIVIFFLLMGLSARFNELTKLSEQNNFMQTEVMALRITNSAIETQIGYATSEVAVEEYAREKGYMVKPGEVLIVPLSQNQITPTPMVIPVIVNDPIPNWRIWYQLFFSDFD
ncbi:MAG TPA: septum formation initiator family protein [Anaerolineaceae bacterium]|nr:septum formation initiator family protein [Anaerolineaceae bacterium]